MQCLTMDALSLQSGKKTWRCCERHWLTRLMAHLSNRKRPSSTQHSSKEQSHFLIGSMNAMKNESPPEWCKSLFIQHGVKLGRVTITGLHFCGLSPSCYSLFLPVIFVRKGSESYVHLCPCPCSSTYRWARLATHQHKGPHPVWSVLSMPTVAVQPPHVCHRQRDWAVSIGSHMQQDMDMSKAPPHLGAPFALCEHHSRLKTTIQKIGDNFPKT